MADWSKMTREQKDRANERRRERRRAGSKKYGMQNRPIGQRWYGRPTDKRSIIKAARESMRQDGTIDKEAFANKIAGFPGGSKGGYDVLRKISFQKGSASGDESAGRGKPRRAKKPNRDHGYGRN